MLKIKLKIIKGNIYLIIPMVCVGFWAFLFLLSTTYDPRVSDFIHFDFKIYYGCGKQILRDPLQLYTYDYGYDIGYVYLPSFACLFAVSISLLPYTLGYFTLYGINIILGILFIREFDKILILKDVLEKIHRFIFLIIISNGFVLLNIFRQNQVKFAVGLILLFVLRREIQYRNDNREKDLKFNLVNYGLFVFAIAMAPYFIFLLLIYIFQEIRFNEIFRKDNIKIYGIVILMFVVQNFLFIVYPKLIFDFLEGFYKHPLFLFYLIEWIHPHGIYFILLSYVSTILTSIITLIIIIKKLPIEEKFAFFAFFALFVSLFANRTLVILLPLTLLLFVSHLKRENTCIDFIKNNLILLFGLFSIGGIYFNVNPETIYSIILNILPIVDGSILMIIIYLRWLILLSIMAISLILLHLKSNKIT